METDICLSNICVSPKNPNNNIIKLKKTILDIDACECACVHQQCLVVLHGMPGGRFWRGVVFVRVWRGQSVCACAVRLRPGGAEISQRLEPQPDVRARPHDS